MDLPEFIGNRKFLDLCWWREIQPVSSVAEANRLCDSASEKYTIKHGTN